MSAIFLHSTHGAEQRCGGTIEGEHSPHPSADRCNRRRTGIRSSTSLPSCTVSGTPRSLYVAAASHVTRAPSSNSVIEPVASAGMPATRPDAQATLQGQRPSIQELEHDVVLIRAAPPVLDVDHQRPDPLAVCLDFHRFWEDEHGSPPLSPAYQRSPCLTYVPARSVSGDDEGQALLSRRRQSRWG